VRLLFELRFLDRITAGGAVLAMLIVAAITRLGQLAMQPDGTGLRQLQRARP
jgi:hypothetical protein